MIGKKIGLAVCFAAIVAHAGAQEMGIELDGGLQGLHYPLHDGQTTPLPGAAVGVNYVFRLNNQWGLLTGITGGVYRTQASLHDGVTFSSYQVDEAGSAFRYDVKFTGYKETQQFFAVNIPLLLQYHTDGIGRQWYFNAGGKVFLPSDVKTQVSAQQISGSGYYPDFNLEVSNLPQDGFGTVNGWKGSATTRLKPAAALSAATGVCFPISPGTRLYAGIYVDYGLTDLKDKGDSMPLVTYSPAGIDKVQANGVLNTQNTGPAKLLSFGLQVRLSFGSAHAKPAAKPAPQALAQQTAQPATQPVTTPAVAPPVQPVTTPAVAPAAQPVTQPAPVTQPVITDSEAEIMERPIIFGAIDEASIPELQQSDLDEVANIMKQHPNLRISIVGHICNGVTETENMKTGEARARAVGRYLQKKGINRRRMDISYVRESDPSLPYDEAANYQNRRVVITVE
jgi:OOP family OmpA-OmpF porin